MTTRNMPQDGGVTHVDPRIDHAEPQARSVKASLASVGEAVKDTAATVAADVKDRAADLLDIARETAATKADEARTAAVETGNRLSETLRDVAARQPEDSFAARAMALMASGLSDLSQKLDGTTVSQAMTEARDVARRHPVATATVAAAVGFALMRLARALPATRHTPATPADRPEF